MRIDSVIYCKNRGEAAMITTGSTFSDIRVWVGQYDEVEAVLSHKGRDKKLTARRGHKLTANGQSGAVPEPPIAEPSLPTIIVQLGPPPQPR